MRWNSARQASREAGGSVAHRPARTPLPCVHADPVPGVLRERMGLTHTKDWRVCTHPELPLRGERVVCPCDGCGRGCRGYESDGPEEEAAMPSDNGYRGLVREKPVRWAYGVTTVPQRRDDLLPRTLASLRGAGFDKPRLFVDNCDDPQSWEREFGLEVTGRFPRIRTYGNWVLGLAELYVRDPAADRYAMFQDDFVTYRNLRAYLESCEYPATGYWNLYTFPSNQTLCPDRGNHEGWYPSNQRGRGAVALVLSREGVKLLLRNQHMVDRPEDPNRGHKAVDGGVVSAMRKAGWKEWVHNPSLVQHTGLHSSMGNRPHKLAASFRGEEFDASGLIGKRVVRSAS